jgi:hypothetical protein
VKRITLALDWRLRLSLDLPASCGVILFRTGSLTPTESVGLAIATLQSGVNWAGHFCAVNDRKIRVTPLPPCLVARDSLISLC